MEDKLTRPELNRNLKSKDFKEFYYLKEELVNFCRKEGLKVSGNKKRFRR